MLFAQVFISLLLTVVALSTTTPLGGIIWGGGWLVMHSWLIGRLLDPTRRGWDKLGVGLLIIITGWIIAGTALYYVIGLSTTVTTLLILAIPILIWLITVRQTPQPQLIASITTFLRGVTWYTSLRQWLSIPLNTRLTTAGRWLLRYPWLVVSIISSLTYLTILFRHQTTESINSFWLAMPLWSLWLLVIAATKLIVSINKYDRHSGILTAIGALTLVTVAGPVIVYTLSYGFDSFIHQAAEKYIAAFGAITPKTPYYIGQYAAVLINQRLTMLPLIIVDRWLLPLGTVLTTMASTVWLVRRFSTLTTTVGKQTALVGSLAFLTFIAWLFMPLDQWLATTPQGLAQLFAVLTALLAFDFCLHGWTKQQFYLISLTVLASIAIHPLVGIPVAGAALVVVIATAKLNSTLRRGLAIITAVLTSLTLPAMFWLQSILSPTTANPLRLHWPTLAELASTLALTWPAATQNFNFWIDTLHHGATILPWALAVLALVGLLWLRRQYQKISWLVVGALSMVLGAMFLKLFVSFDSVVVSERAFFTDRIITLGWWWCLPLVAAGVVALATVVRPQRTTAWLFVGLTMLLVTSNIYAALPHNDIYTIGRAYSTGAADFTAVNWIAQHANSKPYIVLTNQAVGAAALQTFGFNNYISTSTGSWYFYAIPTTSPLAIAYRQTVYNGVDKIALQKLATDFDVSHIYLVLNRYWTNADKVAASLTTQADGVQVLDEGRVSVFWFEF